MSLQNGLRGTLSAAVFAFALIAASPAPALAAPNHGGTLTWLVTPEPASIVPLTTTAGGNAEIGPKVVEGLLTYDKDLNPQPLLATAWSVSKDGLQYRFNLRHGVKWHDGKPFTSADVAFSILTLKQVHPRGRSTFANVTDVKTPDPYTAIIELSKPAPFLLTALSGSESPIVPKHLYEGTDIGSNPYNSAPVGTGRSFTNRLFTAAIFCSNAIRTTGTNPSPTWTRSSCAFFPMARPAPQRLNRVRPTSAIRRFR